MGLCVCVCVCVCVRVHMHICKVSALCILDPVLGYWGYKDG